MYSNKLTLKDVAQILFILPSSISLLSTSDPTFPKLEYIGHSIFIDLDKFYKWLSDKAGETIMPSDKLMTGKDLQAYCQKGHTCKNNNLPKPFKINHTNYWIERVIIGEVEEQSWRNKRDGGLLGLFLELNNIKTIIYFFSKVVIFCVHLYFGMY